jgi:hypothetical protein
VVGNRRWSPTTEVAHSSFYCTCVVQNLYAISVVLIIKTPFIDWSIELNMIPHLKQHINAKYFHSILNRPVDHRLLYGRHSSKKLHGCCRRSIFTLLFIYFFIYFILKMSNLIAFFQGKRYPPLFCKTRHTASRRRHNDSKKIVTCVWWVFNIWSLLPRALPTSEAREITALKLTIKGPGPLQRGDNHKNVKMGWGPLKILLLRTSKPEKLNFT